MTGSALTEAVESAAEFKAAGERGADGARVLGVGGAGGEPDFSGDVATGPIHEVFMFTDEFLSGAPGARPVASQAEWLAPIVRQGKAIGTLEVWRPDGGRAEFAGYDGEGALGDLIADMGGAVLISHGPSGAYYALEDGVLRALNRWAEEEIGGASLPLAQAQKLIAANAASRRAQGPDYLGGGGAGSGTPAGSPWAPVWVGPTIILLALAGVGFFSVRLFRPRRHHAHD